jgi:carbonic anhydrase
VLRILNHAGLNLEQWLVGFENVEDGVISSVHLINHHPLLPRDIAVHGMIIHPETGKLDLLVNGYEED